MQTGTRPVGKYCIPWQLQNVPGTDFGDLVSNHVPMASKNMILHQLIKNVPRNVPWTPWNTQILMDL